MSKEEELRNWSDDDEEEEEEIEEEVSKESEEGAASPAPAATSPSSSPAFGRPSGRGRFPPSRGEGRRFPRKPREYVKYPIPDEPPFTARVSHLPLEMKARELQDFFENTLKCKVEKVTTRFDGEHVKKGTFDVIFEDKQSLEIAIGYDRKTIQDSTANIYVPPPHDPNRPPRQSYGRGYHRGAFRGRHYERRNNFHHDRAGAEGEHHEGEKQQPAEGAEVKKEAEEKKPAETAEGEKQQPQQQEGEKKEGEAAEAAAAAAPAEEKPLSKSKLAKLEKKKREEEYKAKREEKKKKKAAEAAAALRAGDKKKAPAKPANIYDLLEDEDDEVDEE